MAPGAAASAEEILDETQPKRRASPRAELTWARLGLPGPARAALAPPSPVPFVVSRETLLRHPPSQSPTTCTLLPWKHPQVCAPLPHARRCAPLTNQGAAIPCPSSSAQMRTPETGRAGLPSLLSRCQ